MTDPLIPDGSPAALRDLYSRCYRSSAYKMGTARRERMVQAVLACGPHRTFLDVGCGRGELIDAFPRTYSDAFPGGEIVRGCEIVPELCDRSDVHLIQTIVDLPYADRSYECVACADVLEHLDPTDTMPALRELWRVAGRFLVLHIAFFSSPIRLDGVDIELHINRRNAFDWLRLIKRVIGIPGETETTGQVVLAEEISDETSDEQVLFVIERTVAGEGERAKGEAPGRGRRQGRE